MPLKLAVRRVKLKPKEKVYSYGDEAQTIYIVEDGFFAEGYRHSDGKSLYFPLFPGNVFGSEAIYGGGRVSDAFAFTEGSLFSIYRENFRDFGKRNPEFLLRFLEIIEMQGKFTKYFAKERCYSRLFQTTSEYLLSLSQLLDSERIPVSLKDIAEILGFSPKQIVNATSELKEWGMIAKGEEEVACGVEIRDKDYMERLYGGEIYKQAKALRERLDTFLKWLKEEILVYNDESQTF